MRLAARYRNTLVLAVGLLIWTSAPGMAWVTVLIKMGGVDITNKTQDTIVGRRIPLTGEVINGTPTTKSWSIPGRRIKNYTASSSYAAVTNLSSSDLQQSSIAFYWVDGGNGREVTYTVTVNEQIYSAKTTFNVKRPTATLTTTTGSVTISDAWGALEMCFGIPAAPGITFTRTVTEPPGFSGGSVAWFQRVPSTYRRKQDNDEVWWRRSGISVCDSHFPFPGHPLNPDICEDSPGTVLTPYEQRRTVSDSFSMYVMYKPTGTAIWVPLRKVDWNWSGECHRILFDWWLDSSYHSTNPGSSDSTTHPVWTGNWNDLAWQQE